MARIWGSVTVGNGRKCSVAVVVVHEVVSGRTAVSVFGDEQVDIAVVVIVCPGCKDGRRKVGGNSARGDLFESSVAVVVIQEIPSLNRIEVPRGHEQVQEAVVIVVGPGRAGGRP